MDFTLTEIKIIFAALEEQYEDTLESISKAAQSARDGCRFSGNIAQVLIDITTRYEHVLNIQRRILEAVESTEKDPDSLTEILNRLKELKRCKKELLLFEDDEKPETNDTDGVLGDKAQD